MTLTSLRHYTLFTISGSFPFFTVTYPNIDIFLGGGLEELEPEAVGELLASLVADHPLILHVALVPHQNNLGVVPAVGLDLGAP